MNSLQKIGLNQISSTCNSKQNSRIEAVGGLPLKAKAWKNIPPNACKSKHKLSIIQTTLQILARTKHTLFQPLFKISLKEKLTTLIQGA